MTSKKQQNSLFPLVWAICTVNGKNRRVLCEREEVSGLKTRELTISQRLSLYPPKNRVLARFDFENGVNLDPRMEKVSGKVTPPTLKKFAEKHRNLIYLYEVYLVDNGSWSYVYLLIAKAPFRKCLYLWKIFNLLS